ncbi:MAG: ATP-binding protein [Actinomycetota bacterium]
MRDRRDIVRAQWQLWAVAFVIIAGLAGALIFLATSSTAPQNLTFLPSRALLGIALGGLISAFALYAVDRERNLRRLAERLLREQVEAEQMATKVKYLHDLARERDTSAALLDGSADGIAVVDQDFTIVRFNRAIESLCARPSSDALGRRAEEVFCFSKPDGSPLDGAAHPVRAAATDGIGRAGMELRLKMNDGGERWVSATFSPIRKADGTYSVLVDLRDIAEQKEQERMHRDFVSMAAHELRSPLTAIKGFTRTLMLKAHVLSDERRNQYLSMVNEQSNRLAHLVEDLMQVSRIDAGRVVLEPRALDVESTLSDLLDQFKSKWVGREINVARGSDEVPPVLADPHKLEEILINLIDNAVKYSADGTPIDVAVGTEQGDVRVSVRDHGEGIPPDEIPNLFKKFSRIASASTAEVPGTGLGLFIVKGFVTAHGGKVWADSTLGEGSTFTFTLPAASEQARETARAI